MQNYWSRNEKGRLEYLEPLFGTLFDTPSQSEHSSSMEEVDNDNDNLDHNDVRTLQQYLHPTRTSVPSCIIFPPNTDNIDFKHGVIRHLPTFHGMENESPYIHIREFEEIVNTFHHAQATINIVRLKLFPFSLKDKAKSWLYALRPRSIGSWEEMQRDFFKKFFPDHKTNSLKRQMQNFSQKDSETLYMAWERFKDLLNLCPHHGYETWRLVSYFYEGLTVRERKFVEMMCGGEFLQKSPDDAMEFLDEIAEKSHTWTGPNLVESTNRSKSSTTSSGGIYQLREEDSLKAQVASLSRELENIKMHGISNDKPMFHENVCVVCDICQVEGHATKECPILPNVRSLYGEQVDAINTYQQSHSHHSNTYNPSWKNHPNLSYKSNNFQHPSVAPSQAPRNFYASYAPSNPLQDTLNAFMQEQMKANQRYDSSINQLMEDSKEIKSHISKLTNSLSVNEKGKFPAQPQPNPKTQYEVNEVGSSNSHTEHAKSVTTLRSGKVINKEIPMKVSQPKEISQIKGDDGPRDVETKEEERVYKPVAGPIPSKAT